MTEQHKKQLTILGVIAVVIWVVFLWPHVDTWDGDGTVSVFPNAGNVINYKLDAQVNVERHRNGWINGEEKYTVTQVSWPNGGYSDFTKCIVPKDGRSSCTDQDEKTYNVEVTSIPDPPEADSTSDY